MDGAIDSDGAIAIDDGTGPGEVEVAVLGPVEVRGTRRPLRRAHAAELVVYLALHPRGVSTDVWAAALWPDRCMAPATLHSTISAARQALGRSSDGVEHLPKSRGRLRLAASVTTDWHRFEALRRSARPQHRLAALRLVRGRPFSGLETADWPVLEGHAAEMEESVASVALAEADRYLHHGDGAAAAWAARRGLRACPYDERLYRALLRAADAQGNPGGVEAVMVELGRVLGSEEPGQGLPAGPPGSAPPTRGWPPSRLGPPPLALVHPETANLYCALTRRRSSVSGGAVGRL